MFIICRDLSSATILCGITCWGLKHCVNTWSMILVKDLLVVKANQYQKINVYYYENESLVFPGWKGPSADNLSLTSWLWFFRNKNISSKWFFLLLLPLRWTIIGSSNKISFGQWDCTVFGWMHNFHLRPTATTHAAIDLELGWMLMRRPGLS